MKIRPLHDRILLRRLQGQEQTRGGIIIPDSARDKPLEAEVVAVGAGRVGEDGAITPLLVSEGNRVLVGKYCGETLRIEGVEHLIVSENDVLAIVD